MKKLTISILLLAVMILSITAVSAADDVSLDLDDSQDIDVDSTPAPVTSAGDQGVLKASGNTEVLTDPGDKNFTTLQTEIDASEDGTLDLSSNYVRAEGENDIVISKNMWIDGGNNKIDANGLGGIFKVNEGCTLVLSDISLVNGVATEGGAVYVSDGAKLQISNSQLTGNMADNGGAIYSEGSVKITGSTLNDNFATDYGGAIYSLGDLSVKDTTFDYNIAEYGSSIMNYQGTLTLTNVQSNDDKPIYNDKGKITSKVIVTILGNATVDANSFDVVINATAEDENGNEIIDNTLSFLINDEEIEAIYNETAGVYQASYVLPTGGLYTVDAVSSTGSTLDVETGVIKCTKGTFTDLKGKIAEAMAEGTLTLDYGFKYVPELDDGNGVAITGSLNIEGNGYTIDANGADSIFVIYEGTVVLNNITFINSVYHAIVNEADLTITSSVFKDNFCPEESTSGGAAILNRGTLLIDECAFENNTATKYGGAICSGGNLEVKNSNFTSNNATYGSAIVAKDFNITGGMFSENIAQSGTIYIAGGTSTITDATFSENDGGAVYMLRGSSEIDSSVFTGNTADEKGEAIYVSNLASLNVTGSTFSQNGGSKKYAIHNRGTLSLSENDFDNLIYNLGGNIISKTYAVVMGNTTIVPESDDVFITAIVTDDAGNEIKDGSFKFLINDEEIDATFDETLLLYEANYTLPVYGMLYTVSMNSNNYGDLEVLTGAFNNVRGTFTDLQTRIDNAIADGTAFVELPYDITYNDAVDGEKFINGIYINDEVTIDGNGYYIDGANTARIFNIDAFATVNLNDAILKNGNSTGNGGAIYASGTLNIDNCTFSDNTAAGLGDAIYIAPSYQVVVIMDEESYDAQLADPNSALNKYYAERPNEDVDTADPRGHSWAAVQAANLKTDVSELPWIVVNLNKFNGIVDVYYDGEHKFGPWNLSGRDKTYGIISVTNPEDCGMKQFALWGNVDAYATGEVFDPNKIAVSLDGDMITPLDAMSSVSIKDSLFIGDGDVIFNDGVLSLEGNTVSAIINNGNITSTVYSVVMDNETYITLEDTFPINATLTDDKGNLIYDPNFQFTVNGNPVAFEDYDPDTGLYSASISIGLDAASYVISVSDANYDDLDVQIGIIKNGNVGTYTDLEAKLNATINAGETTFVLPYNFTYTEAIDGGKFNSGMILTTALTIIGNGNYIDGAGLVRIFDVETDGVVLQDIEFRNGRAPLGGAIYARADLEIDTCTFINNTADEGNAIYAVTLLDDLTHVDIINSIFTDNGAFDEYAIVNNNADIFLSGNGVSNVIYNNGTINGLITVLDQETVDAAYGQSIVLNATFVDDQGNYIYDPNLEFLIDDVADPIAFTDFDAENGLYTVTYVANTVGLKEVDVNLDYDNLAVQTGYLNISTANVTLTVNAHDIIRKQNETITVYLYDLFGNPLNLTVRVYVNDKNSTNVDEHIEATVNGTFSYNLTGLPVGEYTVTAVFESVEGYNFNITQTNFIVDEYVLPGSYMDLQRKLDAAIAAGETTFVLPYDFSYIEDCDEDFFPRGVVINAPISIDGNDSTISGNHSYRIFYVNASDVNLTNIRFVNGTDAFEGGAVYVALNATNVSISNSRFVNNTAEFGGAVSWDGANGTIDNCRFGLNNATVSGGAIYWYGDNGTITSSGSRDTVFALNTAEYGGAIYCQADNTKVEKTRFLFNEAFSLGGAVYWKGDNGTICDASLYGNNATYGGAVYWNGDNGTLNNTVLGANNASITGGAIYWEGDNGILDTPYMLDNNATYGGAIFNVGDNTLIDTAVFSGNVAELGGAIYSEGKNLTVIEGLFVGNSASQYGGAIFACDDVNVTLSSFDSNTAEYANAIAVAEGNLYLDSNNINTEAADVVVDANATIISYLNITVLGNTTVDITDDVIVLNATIVDDMGNLIEAEGFSFTINGNQTVPATYNNVTKLYEAEFDIPEGPGIYYINMTYVETEMLDTYIGIIRNIKGTYTDLQNKIDATEEGGLLVLEYDFAYTEAIDGDKFPEGVVINVPINIDGNKSTISGNNSYRIFYINASDVNITTLRFVHGNASGGGAVYVDFDADNVTIHNSIFINNTAEAGGAICWFGDNGILNMSRFIGNNATYYGGAVYWFAKNGLITGDSTAEDIRGLTVFISNNADTGGSLFIAGDDFVMELAIVLGGNATNGGGAYVEFVADNITIRDSVFAGSNATYGGAIFFMGGNATINNTLFFDNSAGVGGAVCWLDDTNLTISDSEFSENEAIFGGAIYAAGDVSIANSIFEDNVADVGNAICVFEGKLSLENNTINTEAADIYVSESATIVSYVNVTVLGNTTVETYGFDAVLNATVTDDMGNLIEAEGFKFLINDEEVDAVYNNETNLYEAEYTLPGISIYPVGMTYTETENLDVYIGIINNLKTGTYTDLQRRINIALANGEDLVLPYNFTYNEEIDGENFPNGVLITGDLIIDGNGYTISSNNSDVNVFTIEEGRVVTIANAIMTGVNGTSIEYGAVINHGDLTLNNCTIRDNTILKASYGNGAAAIFNDGNNLVINGSSIINNTAPFEGSLAAVLIRSAGTVYINDTIFTDNSANLGGAIHVMSNNEPVIIENCVFDNNNAYEAPDVLSDSEVVISDSYFYNEREDDIATIVSMGTLYLFSNYVEGSVFNDPQGTLALDSNKITGFIYNEGTITTLTNATFLDNKTIAAELGEEVIVYGTLTDDNGNAIWDVKFNITLNGVVLDDLFVDMENKTFFTNYTIEYAGLNVVSTTYDATVINIGIFDVPKANVTQFTVVVGGQENRIPYGENATVYVTLLGVDGVGLTETITVVVNDIPYTVDVVDGEAQFNVSGLEPGDYSATGLFINNRNYNDAYATGLFTILEPDALLSVEIDDITVGEDLYVTIHFTDAFGNPIAGLINIEIGDQYALVGVYGETTFTVPGFAVGNYTAYVRFDGDEKYGRLSNSTNFTVKQIDDYDFYADAKDTPFNEQPVLVVVTLPEDATGNVTLTINGETFNATVEEGEAVIEVSGLTVGEYPDVEVVYSGDENYVAGTTTVDINVVRANPHFGFIIENYTIDYRENTTGSIFINENATGNISVYYWNYDIEDYEFMFNLTVEEAQNGIPLDNFNAGKHYILVVYSGDENFKGDEDEDWFTVGQITPELGIEITGDLVVDGNVTITFTTPEDVDGIVGIIIDGVDVEFTGANGTYTVTLNNFTAGTHTAIGYITGDTNYIGLSEIEQFNVTKNDPTIEIDVAGETVADGSVTVTVTLPEDVTNYVLVDVNGMSYFGIPEDGVFTFDIDDLEAITYDVVVTYTGDDKYNKANATTSIVVAKASSAIEIDGPSEAKVGDNITVEVTVSPETATGNYSIFIDGVDVTSEYGETILFNGEGSFIVIGLAEGNHTIGVQYNGDENYNASDIDEYTIEVTRINTTEIILVIGDEIEYGDVATITVILPEDATGSVRVKDGDNYYFANVTDGIAVINITGLDVGEYEFEVGYIGDDKYTGYEGVVNVNVTVADPDFEIWIEDNVIDYGESALLEIYLNESATGNVEIYAYCYTHDEWTLLYNITVEEAREGVLIGNLTVGVYDIVVMYSGDEHFDWDYDNEYLYVEKINPELGIEVTGDLVVDGEVNITFTTPEDVDGNITILVDGEEVPFTGANGTYTVTVNNFMAGNHTVIGYITDDTNYNDLSAIETFCIDKVDPSIVVTIEGDAVVDNNVTVVVTLPEDAAGYIVFSDGEDYFFDEFEGGQCTVEYSIYKAGELTIGAFFTGNDKYNEAVNFTTVNVAKASSAIDIDGPSEAKVGDNITVEVNVSPETATGNYSIFIDGVDVTSEYGETILFNGEGSFIVIGLAEGNHTIGVQYNGDENYNASDIAEYTVEVTRINTTEIIKVIGDEIEYGETAIIMVILPEDATGSVRVKHGDNYYFDEVEDGIAIIAVPGLAVGEYEFDVGYIGDDKYTGYEGVVNVNVTVADPDLEVWFENLTVSYRDDVILSVYINESATGNISIYEWNYETEEYEFMFNVTVEEALNGVLLGNDFTAGEHYILAVYSGDNNFDEDWDGYWFYVEKIDPELAIEVTGDLVVDGEVNITFTTPEDVDGIIGIVIDSVEVEFTGENGTYTVTVNNFTAGSHTVLGYLYNDTNYNGLSEMISFNITKVDPALTIEVEDIHVGDDEVITIILPDDATNYVLYEVGDVKTYAELENGKATITIPGLAEGNYTITVTYTGDDKYNIVENLSSFEVSKVSEYNMTVETASADGNITVDVNLPEDATGTVTVTINGTDYNATVEDGNATVRVDNLPPGETNVTIAYTGDDKYVPKNTTVSVDNTKKDAVLTAEMLEMYVGDGSEFTVVLKDTAGNPIAGRGIKVNICGKTYTIKTNSSGIAVLPINLKVGSYNVSAWFNGDAVYNASANVSTTVEVYTTVRIAENKDLTKTEGGPEKFTVRALDKYGKPVGAYAKVKMTVGGKLYTVSTDANGYASLPINLKAGLYSISSTYGGTTVVNTITVKAKN